MAGTLVVAEIVGRQGSQGHPQRDHVRASRSAAPFAILAIGAGAAGAAKELAAFGAAKVIAVDDASLKDYVAERFAPTVAQVAKSGGFDTVVGDGELLRQGPRRRASRRSSAPGTRPTSTRVKVDGRQAPVPPADVRGQRVLLAARSRRRCRSSASGRREFTAAEPSGGASPVESVARAADDPAAARVEFVKLEVGQERAPRSRRGSRRRLRRPCAQGAVQAGPRTPGRRASAPPSARAARRATRATRRPSCRSGRRGAPSRPSSTSRSASPAPSSTSPA